MEVWDLNVWQWFVLLQHELLIFAGIFFLIGAGRRRARGDSILARACELILNWKMLQPVWFLTIESVLQAMPNPVLA